MTTATKKLGTMLGSIAEMLKGEDGEVDVEKRIAHRGDKWVVLDSAGKKVLGTHDSEDAAKRQLRAIEANKSADAFFLPEYSAPVNRKAWEGLDGTETEDALQKMCLVRVDDEYRFPYRDAKGWISAAAVRAITDEQIEQIPESVRATVKSHVARLRKRVEDVKGDPVTKAVSLTGRVVKSDEMKQILVVPVLVPEDVDAQDDIYSHDEVEKAAHLFMRDYVKGESELGLDHERVLDRQKAHIVELWIEKADVQYGDEVIPKGTWMIAIHIPDVEVWKSALAGERTGASIEGTALSVPV